MSGKPLTKSIRHKLHRASRPLRDWFTLPLLEFLRLVVQSLPHGWALVAGRWLGRVAWVFSRKARHLAERQLSESGLYRDPKAARRAAREVFESLGMTATEWLNSIPWSAAYIRQQIRVEGFEKVQEVLNSGKGVILVPAHLGNWELLPGIYVTYSGHPVAAIMAQQRNNLLNQWLVRLREQRGTELLSSHAAVLGMVRHLLRGGTLGLLGDQDSTRGRGQFVEFFGRPAYTPSGPAHLAQRTGAPIVTMTVTRERDDPRRHVCRFSLPIWSDAQANPNEDLRRMTQAYTSFLEEAIRANPTQWVWVHDRWHHRPGSRIRVRSAGKGVKLPAESAQP